MPRRAHPLILLPAVLLCLAPGARAQQGSVATYSVTFQGTWTTTVTPGGVPSGAHFTTLIGGVHNAGVTFLSEGGMASAGVEFMAELGGTSTLANEVRAAEPNALSVIRGSGNIGPTSSSTINTVTLTTDHPRVTLLTMIAPSPDWFTGVFGLSLLDAQGDWLPSLVVNLYPWDAGTEEGTEFSLSNPATSPQGVITSLRGTGKFSNERIATLTFTRQSVNTAPSFTSDTSFEADENQTVAGTLAAADPDNGDGVAYAITGGADASKFDIGETTGVLTFKTPPNYERAADVASTDPLNEAGNNEYIVTVTATGGTDDRAMTTEQTITVTVRNLEEAGKVSFSQVGAAIRAKLSDPDGGVSSAAWQWARSSERSTGWTNIGGATSASYTPSSDDEEMYLRATVSYDDAHGSSKQAQGVSSNEITPTDLEVGTLVSGLSIPWDIAFAPDGTMLFTQRAGVLSSRLTDGTVQTIDAEFGDLFARGETGLMGIVVDPGFASNRRFYTCQGHVGPEIQVIAWTINAAYTVATRVADPLVGGMPAVSGRHGGCRLRFGPQGYLWIATGDAASGTVPQDPTSLGGKVLRVDASTGAGAPANPFASSPRIYTYGHRNVQGLALRPGTNQMWSVEHGPSVDDEINLLVAGRNYGWDPVPGYNERVPMTDLVKFPDSLEAKWSSGSPTLAASGGIFLEGDQWGVWEGRLAVATLKDSKLRLFEFTPDGAFVSQVVVPELDGAFGRLRTPMMGPDGALYVTTSNGGGGDRILRIATEEGQPPPPPPPGGGQTAPSAPRNLTAVAGHGLVVLRWEAPENDGGAAISDYEYRIDRSNAWISTGSTNTTHTVTGLDNGATYVFEVRAVNRIGKSWASNRVEVTPEAPELEAFTLDFAHFANGKGITSEVVLLNVGTTPIRPALYFSDRQGDPVTAETVLDVTGDLEVQDDGGLTVRTAMEPLGELTIATHGRGEEVSGSVQVVSEGAIGGALRYSVPGVGVTGVGAGPPVRDALFPARRQQGGIRTAAAIHNLGEEAMKVRCRLMSGGAVLEEAEIPLEPNGQTSWFIEKVFTATDTADFVGTVRCTAPLTFSGLAVEVDAGNRIFTTLPVVPVAAAVEQTEGEGRATTLDFAHFANGGNANEEGISSELVFVNVQTQPSRPAGLFTAAIPASRPAIYFYDTQGDPIAPETVVEVTGDLEVTDDGGLTVRTEMAPLGELTISTHGRGSELSGSVQVVSEGAIGGVLRYSVPGVGVTGVGAGPPVGDALFPARRREGGIRTAAAMHNLGEEAMEVTCRLMSGGAVLEEVGIPLGAKGQTSWFIEEAFTMTDTSDFVGTVRCTAPGEGKFTGLAVEVDAANRIFTTLPVVPVEESMSQE